MVLAALLVAVLQADPARAAPPAHDAAAQPAARGRRAFDAAVFDPLVAAGIRRGAYPGAALVVGRRDTILVARGYGHLTWSTASPAVDPESTLYDLASLTKVMATTSCLMLLVERGKVRLDAPVAAYLPAFRGAGTTAITVRQLLTHTSGLRPDLPDSELKRLPDSAALLRRVLDETPRVPPGSRVIYSDLNAILLGEVIRRVSGEPLDVFAGRELFAPLGLRETMFRPGARLRDRIAPTGVWRGHAVAGVVNDASAFKLGGVSGNAGLFATAADVARFAQFVLRNGALRDGRRLLDPATVREFTAKTADFGAGTETRALGWQTVPTGETVSSAGTLFGPRSFGHTGWTGTSLWIDPDRDLFVVLLTNRAYAPRARRPFTLLKAVRGRVADAAARASDGR
ncbi:MAG TPA: serine hydrolase domain-containing protein [Gemmatimonadales bacterium]|nr:serine hydrolase domain-containing protein [Gemmatimonadales bacterium]